MRGRLEEAKMPSKEYNEGFEKGEKDRHSGETRDVSKETNEHKEGYKAGKTGTS